MGLVSRAAAAAFAIVIPVSANAQVSVAGGDEPARLAVGIGAYGLVADRGELSPQILAEWRGSPWRWGIGPLAGAWATGSGAAMGYLGLHWDVRIEDRWSILLAFAPGLQAKGGAMDLGGPFAYHSSIGAGYALDSGWRIGLEVTHVSNGWTYKDNPGVESVLMKVSVPIE